MSFDSAQQRAAIDRPLVLRARPDVQLAPVQFSGQTGYVLKDPLTLELFHLTCEEFFLFDKLRQAISLKSLQQAFQQRFAPRQISPQQLQEGVNQLHGQGLLMSEASGQGSELLARAKHRRRTERWQSWLRVLSFRLGSIDATRLVDGLHRRVRWLLSVPVLAITLAVFAYALAILLGQGREVIARLPSLSELTQPRYLLLYVLTIIFVKVIHELAHAVTCKHFGGRCHEIGVLLLAMIPCLYCDVSDVWRLPSKWQRIAVSAAGMIVELVIASIALIGWWYAQPGLLQAWCLSLVIVCSIGTVLINANPLLRYDGYYILSDWIEVPNLSGRAQGLLPGALRRWLLAEPRTADPLLSARQQQGLWFYAVAARVYLMFVILGIFVVLLTWAKPYRLENLVYTLGVITLLGMMVQPASGVWRLLRNPSTRYRMRRPRLAGLATLVLIVGAAFFFWPITRSVRGPAVFVPTNSQPVYATAAGELQHALPPGSVVQAGDIVAQLSDPHAQLAIATGQGEYEVRRVRHEQLDAMRSLNDRNSQLLPTARAALNDAAAQLKQYQRQVDELTIRAPADGVVVAPPAVVDSDGDETRLPVWSGSPLDSRNLGCWIDAGTLLCTVAAPKSLEALVAIDQADATEVQPGQHVRLLLETSPVELLTGTVTQVARRSEQRTASDRAIDAGKYHLVQVRLDSQDVPLLVGLRATAKIEARRSTLSSIVTNQLQQMLRLPW
ncbi:MAG: HlyD family efflux transporter periplasmic adaptor subunit [Bythopirellula sp.]